MSINDCIYIFVVTILALVVYTVVSFNYTKPESFTYNKHEYIRFGISSVVHSPDCKHCFNLYD